MRSFEQAFATTEKAAAAAQMSAGHVAVRARALTKAARSGDIAALKRAQARLDEALTALRQEVVNAVSCWPFTDEEEQRLLADPECYAAELRSIAADKGLEVQESEGVLISYPSIVRTAPAERAVRVDKKKIATIRPSHLADVLISARDRASSFSPQRFIEALYDVYTDIVGGAPSALLKEGGERVVPLGRIYRLMTALPGSAREYDRRDFARDLYTLESKGPHQTRKGATVSFPSSTGTRQSRDLFSFMGPDGTPVTYYGIRFREGAGG